MSNPPVTSTCLGSSGAPQNVSSHTHPTLTDQQQRTQYVIANNPRCFFLFFFEKF